MKDRKIIEEEYDEWIEDNPAKSGFGIPIGGLYYHIAITGNGFTVDIAAPVDKVSNFSEFMQYCCYLGLFCSNDDFKDMVKKEFIEHTKINERS